MSFNWTGKSVLVVDDSRMMREKLVRMYQDLGLRVIGEAADGIEALNFLDKQDVDLVSLDIIMPNMDGIECYRKIRSHFPKVRTMLVSCLSVDSRVAVGFSEEIFPEIFLPKMPDIEVLKATLTAIFARSPAAVPTPTPVEAPAAASAAV